MKSLLCFRRTLVPEHSSSSFSLTSLFSSHLSMRPVDQFHVCQAFTLSSPCQMSAYMEGRTTRLSSTETSRSRSSQEDFLCGDPPMVAAEPQYHPGPLGGGTTHSGRKPGGSSSSDVQYRCDPVEVSVGSKQDISTTKGPIILCYVNFAGLLKSPFLISPVCSDWSAVTGLSIYNSYLSGQEMFYFLRMAKALLSFVHPPKKHKRKSDFAERCFCFVVCCHL